MASHAPLIELRGQLEARAGEFEHALPSHIKPEHFQRATLTAISQNPKLLEADRRSLFNALMRCAQDGLIPDGRQAALVMFRDRERGQVAQYMPMVAGIRRLVQQSGEITRFEQTVVYENDEFDCSLGDRPHLRHRPAFDNRGAARLVYSIAQFRDGSLSREIMTVDEIEKVRQVSRAKDDGPWRDWWDEMARKTVAKRHAKILPMSNDVASALARDDDEHFELSSASPALPPRQRPSLADQLDALAPPSPAATEKRPRRGRPRKSSPPDDDAEPDDIPPMIDADEVLPDDDQDAAAAPASDYLQGKHDAMAGRVGCLNSDISNDSRRMAEWQRGYDSVKKQR